MSGAVHRVELNQIIIDVPRVNDEGVNSYTFNFFRPLLWGLAGWAVAGPPVQNVPPGKVVQDEEDVEKARLQFMNKAVERIGDVSVATVGVGVIIETFAMGTGSYEAGRQGENAAEYIMGEPPAEAAPAVPPEAAPAVPPEAPPEVPPERPDLGQPGTLRNPDGTLKNPADQLEQIEEAQRRGRLIDSVEKSRQQLDNKLRGPYDPNDWE